MNLWATKHYENDQSVKSIQAKDKSKSRFNPETMGDNRHIPDWVHHFEWKWRVKPGLKKSLY